MTTNGGIHAGWRTWQPLWLKKEYKGQANLNRYIRIHGHFYQPPRENPWLEIIEVQDSAYPYYDWNERIAVECYGPNTASRMMNAEN